MTGLRTFVGGLTAAVLTVTAGVCAPFPDGALTARAAGQATAVGPSQLAVPLPPALLECPDLAAALRGVAANDARLRDFSLLSRYRDANRTLGAVDVVFMGDSITDAWPQERFGPFFPGKRYVSRGISGQTTPQMLVRMRPDVINLKPKAVVVLAGTNDINGNTGPMTDESGLMKTELTNDDLHPNAAGYAVMAPLAQAAIDEALN